MSVQNVLILDTETTGLEPATDRVIEVGMILYSVTHRTILQQFSTLFHSDANPVEHINHIPVRALRDKDTEDPAAMAISESLMERGDVVAAHNAEFDRAFYPIHKPWICTKSDFTWPHQNRPGDSLVNLALAHGIGVSSAHRALTDCQLIAALFDRMGENLAAMIERALRPKATFRALVSFDDRQKAKDAGFNWNADARVWTRTMAIEDAGEFTFEVRRLS